jgi:fructose-1,6-bisphosphatase/inositol monophosphatase family enzyme
MKTTLTPEQPSSRIHALISAVREAGSLVRNAFLRRTLRNVKRKSNKSDVVTDIDLKSEQILTSCLQEHFPEISILAEESYQGTSPPGESQDIAIIDPLDGTTNFVTNIPYFSISLYIASKASGQTAIIHNPITDSAILADSSNIKFLLRGKPLPMILATREFGATQLDDLTCGYSISPQVTEPFRQYLYALGVKRVLSNWSPAHDYMNLVLNQFDSVVSLSDLGFSEAAGIHMVAISAHHDLYKTRKRIEGREYPFTISARQECLPLIVDAVCRYEPT